MSHLHSIEQIAVGGMIGVGCASVWVCCEAEFVRLFIVPLLQLQQELGLPVVFVTKFCFAGATGLLIFHKDILKILTLIYQRYVSRGQTKKQ